MGNWRIVDMTLSDKTLKTSGARLLLPGLLLDITGLLDLRPAIQALLRIQE